MRWVLASVGLLVVIVVFSMAALDQRDVVWESGVAKCPHCRSGVNDFSSVCADCGRAFDWKAHDVACDWCLSTLDATYYAGLLEENEEAWEEKLVSLNLTEERQDALLSYVKGLRPGKCTFCGGTGKWLDIGVDTAVANGGRPPRTVQLEGFLDGDCPVCFGHGRCVACDGDHLTSVAREAATRGLATLGRRLARIDPRRDEASAEVAFDKVALFVKHHAGTQEITGLWALDEQPGPGSNLNARAKPRLSRVLRLIEELPGDR